MPIDARMVKWDEEAPAGINPSMVKWDDAAQPITRTEKIAKGLKDPIEGGAQLLTKVLPDSVVSAGNRLNNWLADKTGLVAKLPEGGVDQQVRDSEAEYQAKRAASGESGFDGYRMLGNVANPANLALAAKAPAMVAGARGLMQAGGVGAASALLNPVTDGDYWGEKGKQLAVGAVGGAAVPAITKGVSRVISPNASRDVSMQMLKREGINPTIGQTLGGVFNKAEEKAISLPIIGDGIAAARGRANEDLNRAVFNRALNPIGKNLPAGVTGQEAVEMTRKALGDAYESLLPKMTIQADNQFAQSVNNLKGMVSQGALDPKYAAKFEQILNDRVLGKMQGQNAMTGQTFKDVQSHITSEIKRFGQSQDPDARLLGDALKELGDQMRELSVRSNPQLASQLSAINKGYAQFKVGQKAASYLGAEGGVFNANQLQGAIRAADRSKDKARFAEGRALMQDLGDVAKERLGSKVPNSGTADRLLNIGAYGSVLLNPAIPAGLVAGRAAYSPTVQRALNALVSTRPGFAQPVAQSFEKAAPFLLPAGAQVSLGLLE